MTIDYHHYLPEALCAVGMVRQQSDVLSEWGIGPNEPKGLKMVLPYYYEKLAVLEVGGEFSS